MARANTDDVASPYYPPRARWYGGVFYVVYAFRRALHLERVHLPAGISPFQFLLSLIVPGAGFVVRGRRMWSAAVFGIYVLSALIFLVALGHPLASLGFGLLISAHAIGVFYLTLPWLRNTSPPSKIVTALATLVGVWLVMYLPLITLAERHWFKPLRAGDQVMIVSPRVNPGSLQRGEWVAIAVGEENRSGLRVNSGVAWGPVVALGGDRIEFGDKTFRVNGGASQALLPRMPTAGEVVVPENHWFVWPNLVISAYGMGVAANGMGAWMRAAMVSPDQFVGRHPDGSGHGISRLLRRWRTGRSGAPQCSLRGGDGFGGELVYRRSGQ